LASLAVIRSWPIRSFRVVRILMFVLVGKPTGVVARWNRSSWQMRINSAGVDNQSLVESRSCEVLGFIFSLKRAGRARASPFCRQATSLHLKSNVPGIRHLSLEQSTRAARNHTSGDATDVQFSCVRFGFCSCASSCFHHWKIGNFLKPRVAKLTGSEARSDQRRRRGAKRLRFRSPCDS
jgi:hypothetical protein